MEISFDGAIILFIIGGRPMCRNMCELRLRSLRGQRTAILISYSWHDWPAYLGDSVEYFALITTYLTIDIIDIRLE